MRSRNAGAINAHSLAKKIWAEDIRPKFVT